MLGIHTVRTAGWKIFTIGNRAQSSEPFNLERSALYPTQTKRGCQPAHLLPTITPQRIHFPMSTPARRWLVKQEPSAYSWTDFLGDGRTAWTGVRNFQARKNLHGMREGDLVLFYHSVVGKEVVGIARVVREAYPDPTATEGEWVCVDLAPEATLPSPVSLDTLKSHPTLCNIPLIKQSRLSVMPLDAKDFDAIVELGRHRS
jgi:predicted RNA-binding protein with PUA-like domain